MGCRKDERTGPACEVVTVIKPYDVRVTDQGLAVRAPAVEVGGRKCRYLCAEAVRPRRIFTETGEQIPYRGTGSPPGCGPS